MFFLSNLATSTNFWSQYWLIFVLLALIIVMYVVSFTRRKKYNNQIQDMVNSLKPGDKVKTYSGFYGTIVSIKETTDGKVVLLEMGEGSKVSYTTVDVNAIYGIDAKEDVVYDKDGNIIMEDDKAGEKGKEKKETEKENLKTKSEENKENIVEAEATTIIEENDNKEEVEKLEEMAEGKTSKSKKSKKNKSN